MLWRKLTKNVNIPPALQWIWIISFYFFLHSRTATQRMLIWIINHWILCLLEDFYVSSHLFYIILNQELQRSKYMYIVFAKLYCTVHSFWIEERFYGNIFHRPWPQTNFSMVRTTIYSPIVWHFETTFHSNKGVFYCKIFINLFWLFWQL